MAVRITKSAVNIREKLAELERPVGITGAALMKTETPQEAFSLIGARNRNVIINGAMVVNQRGFTGSSGATANGAYTTDRFFIEHSQDGAVSAGQTTMNSTVGGNAYADGFNSALHYRVTTADASLSANQYALIAQPIEGFNVQGFKKGTANAQQFTLSFWVRSSLTGTYIAELRDNDNTRFVSKSYTIDTANTWEKKTLTYPADTTGVLDNDNGGSLYVFWWLAAGSTYTSGTLGTTWHTTAANRTVGQVNFLATAGNNFFLTSVQLEVGKVATDFEYRSIDDELSRCQRYYNKYYPSNQEWVYVETGNQTNHRWWYCPVIPGMRATPNVNFIGTWTGAIFGGNSITAISLDSAKNGNGAGYGRMSARVTTNNTTYTSNTIVHTDAWNANGAYVEFISEL